MSGSLESKLYAKPANSRQSGHHEAPIQSTRTRGEVGAVVTATAITV